MNDHSAVVIAAQGRCPPIAPTTGRLIRLGRKGCWARHAIDTGTVRFGFADEPHDLCFAGDWDGVRNSLLRSGRTARKATELTRQLQAFYTLGLDALWIASVDKHLYWGFAETEVIDLRGSGDGMGVVARDIRGGWNCHNVVGQELLIAELGSEFSVLKSSGALRNLNKLAAICHTINGHPDFGG